MRSLQARVVLVGVVGAVVVAAVAVVLALPFVRSVARDESRDQLARAVDTLAARPQATRRLLRAEQAVLGRDARTFHVVRPSRPVPDAVVQAMSDGELEAVRRQGAWSGTGVVDGQEVLVEARLSRGAVVVVGLQPVEGLDEIDGAFVRRLVLALVVGVAVSAAVAIVVARRVVRPVRAAARSAHLLAEGNRGVPMSPVQVTEVAELTAALSALDSALAQSEGRQREFLLSISHELRTPLTALGGYAEALRDGAVESDDVSRVGGVLVEQAARLDRFVVDLLSLARLEADDFAIVDEPVDLAAVMSDVAAAWEGAARREDVALTVRAERLDVMSDGQRLRQLLDGLVENALRATPARGHVVLEALAVQQTAVVRVVDDGPGLRPGDHGRAFERGYLREHYVAEREVGTGLGLSIAHGLAGRLGATLEAGPAPGGGTVMELRLRTVAVDS